MTSFPTLEIEDADGQRTFEVTQDVLRIGRASDNDVSLRDRRVSKRHMVIRRGEHGRWYVVDSDSKAGVFLNGGRVYESELASGDILTLGPRRLPKLVFRASAASAGASSKTSTFLQLADTKGREGLQKLALFLEFTRLIGGRVDLTEILENVVDLAMEITGSDRGFLVMLRPGRSMEFRVARGKGKVSIPRAGVTVSETIIAQALREKEPCIVADLSADEDLAGAQSVRSLDLGSAAALPMWRFALTEGDASTESARPTDDIFGILYLDGQRRTTELGNLDRGLLEALARDASGAIENARLLRESEDKVRLEREVEMARDVQASLLPETFESTPFADVFGACVPCLELGGDYLGEFKLHTGELAFAVADVCGKGIPASLLAAALQGALVAELATSTDLALVAGNVNRVVDQVAPPGMFITLVSCALGPDGMLRWLDAGHGCGVIVRADKIEKLQGEGAALGMAPPDFVFTERALELRPGDAAVFFTDGVVECRNAQGELLGGAALEAILSSTRDRTAEEIVSAVLHAIERFRGDQPVTDDVTVLVVKYKK